MTNPYDEFYTQLHDIENELQHYEPHFKGKVVYCNCDDPYVSNFFKYFSENFDRLGLKRLITTCYKNQKRNLFSKHDSEKAIMLEYDGFWHGDRSPKANEIGVKKLKSDGDFRNVECIEILERADIVVTNPPFSLFREYVLQLIGYDKKFIIIGPKYALGYKEIFPLIKENKLWTGYTSMSKDLLFDLPKNIANEMVSERREGSAYVLVDGIVKGRSESIWLTNVHHQKRNEQLDLKFKYKPDQYPHYDNFDAIEVSRVNNIPIDWEGVMGVPITFLDKHNPDQFEIVGFRKGDDGKDLSVNGKDKFTRILIRNRKIITRAKPNKPTGQNNKDLFNEGFKRSTKMSTYERNRKNREAAINEHGVRCFGCEKEMAEMYGTIADGYIHIHHTKPFSLYNAPRKPDLNELIPLCPNCHAVVHLEDPPVSVERLKTLLSGD